LLNGYIFKTDFAIIFMFGSLKEKLKKWVSKTKETEEVEESLNVEKEGEKNALKKEKIKEDKKKIKEAKKEEKRFKKSKKREEITEVERREISKEGGKEKVKVFEKEGKEKEIFEKGVEKEDDLGEEVGEVKEFEKTKEKTSFFSRFQKKFSEEDFEKIFEELELILLQNNVAYEVVDSIRDSLKERLVGKNLRGVSVGEELKNSIKEILINPPDFLGIARNSLKEKSPFVILFAGINGSGKTTTIAKIANYLLKNKLSVCLCAADTFRAASIEQIQQHADNLKIPLIKKDYGADPAAVGFDAIAYAKKHHINVVLIDTAGRMQNKDSLMKEIEKVVRVNKPDMKFFIGESITGNDAVEQAKTFNETINLTGIILSKADVDEKGGTAISVSHVTKKPIYFLGTGQEYKDIEIFNKDKLIEKIGL
jgi:fused signal recognition particle receptor